MTIKYSFPPVVDARTRVLVLGSLPGEKSLAAQRYYANPQNQLWCLMSPVIGRDLVALDYDARLAALLAARVGLWDVVASARRDGSTDAAIRDLVANDLAGLVRSLPECARSASTAPPRIDMACGSWATPTAISPSSPCPRAARSTPSAPR